jgi:outer membrane biosynthesis protein TonB
MSAAAMTSDWRIRNKKKTALAAIVSIVVHLLLILLLAWLLGFRPSIAPPAPEEPAVEITFLNELPRMEPQYIETSEAQRSEKAPENPAFESDKDTQAASELPASGNAPVPTMEGEDAPTLSMENRNYTAGLQPRPAAPPAQPAEQQAPPEPKTEPKEEPKPEPKTEPIPTPRPNQIALLEPPKPKTEPKPETPKPAEKTPAKPAQPSAPGYQPQTRVTRIRGNISNRGRASVAANATPLGRYKKLLSDAIGSRWYYYVNDQMGLLDIGTLEVRFIVKENGKVEGIRVVSNSSNESFAACSVQAIMEAEIPPIPKELVPMLENGRIEIEYSFTILSN